MHIIGIFPDPSDVGGLVDTLKNSGIERRDMIISAYDEEKFAGMEAATQSPITNIMSDQEDLGEIDTFAQGVKDLDNTNGIVVCIKCPRHKSEEVKSVMEQSGALEIVVK
jgi:hypothetical protein